MKKLAVLAVMAMVMVMGVPQAMAQKAGGPDGKGPMMGKERGPRHEQMFERLDKDGDGAVTKEEFMSMHEEMFAKLDANSDGKITKEEATEAREKMWEKMKERRAERREQRGQDEAPAAE